MRRTKGFTLVELVVGMVVLAIALTVITTMLVTQSKDSVEPVHRVRAAELGQSLLNEILSRAYDENSDHNGGLYRCGEIWQQPPLPQTATSWFDGSNWQISGTPVAIPCTAPGSYGNDGEVRASFNDVDDYQRGFDDGPVQDALGASLPDVYQNFKVRIVVTEDSSLMPGGAANQGKRIDLTVKTPTGEEINFSVIRGNY